MLSILVLSHKGEGYEVANRLKYDGHSVKFWQENPSRRTESGLHWATKVDRYEEHLPTTDLVVAISPGVGGAAERIRKRGCLAVGGGIQKLLSSDPSFSLCTAKLLGFELQPPPTQGQDLILCGWFNGTEWLETYLVQEYTRLLDRNRGPVTEGMGFITRKQPGLLTPLVSVLSSSEYRGFLGVKVSWVDGIGYFNGFTTQLSGGILSSIVECARVRLSDHLYAAAGGGNHIKRSVDCIGQAVRVLAFDQNTKLNPTEQASKHLWEHREGESLGFVASSGENHREARRRCYRTINNICGLDAVYRSDIGFSSIHDNSEVVNALS